MPKRLLTLVIGDINRDLFLYLPTFPKPGRDNPAASFAWGLGGSAVNPAALLIRLRVYTGVIGRVGKDTEGLAIIRQMRKLGIQTRYIQRDTERPTGVCAIPVTTDGDRTIIGARGANLGLASEGLAEAIPGIRHLHVSGYTLLEAKTRKVAMEALRLARESGATTSLDFTWHGATEVPDAIREALPHVTAALPSAPELRMTFGIRQLSRAAEAAMEQGTEQVAATLGAGGCRVFWAGKAHRVPPFALPVINTCSVGDAFNAGYIFGLIEGGTPAACAVIGNAAGALAAASEHPHQSLTRSRLAQIIRNNESPARHKELREASLEAAALLSRRSTKTRRRRR